MTGRVGVAISTTGHKHRMEFLETCVRNWDACLPSGASLFVTVDGDADDTKRVAWALREYTESVYRVGQTEIEGNRRGVAVNKNTGLELLVAGADAEHLFLSDDDTWPIYPESLEKHLDLGYGHSMVMWGKSRLEGIEANYAKWKWPRGVVLYVHRNVVDIIGGMDERFGAGGHEHAEYSTRIHNARFTPTPFISPASYATRNAMGARALWHAEDMPYPGELGGSWISRKRRNTTIKRDAADWDRIHSIMADREGSSDFVAFRAHENGRASATLSADLMGQGAGGET